MSCNYIFFGIILNYIMSVFTIPSDTIHLPSAPSQKIEYTPNFGIRKLFVIIVVIGIISALAVAALMYQNGDTQTSGIVLMTAGGIGLLTMIISAIVKARSSTHG